MDTIQVPNGLWNATALGGRGILEDNERGEGHKAAAVRHVEEPGDTDDVVAARSARHPEAKSPETLGDGIEHDGREQRAGKGRDRQQLVLQELLGDMDQLD